MDEQLFVGMGGMTEGDQRLLWRLVNFLGVPVLQRVWELYQETNLVEAKNGQWQLWGDRDESKGTYIGPIAHSLVVAQAMRALAEKLGFDDRVVRTLTLAGLVHDAFKRKERESNFPDSIHQAARTRISQLFGQEIADFAELSGHTAMPEVLRRWGNLVVAVAFWVDNAVVGTTISPAAKKCDYLDLVAPTRYSYNPEGEAEYGVYYFTFQRYLACVLEAVIVAALNARFGLKIRPTTELATYVGGLVEELTAE